MIALVHVARAQTGMSEVEYRDLLAGVGAASATELTPAQFEEVVAHFAGLGFVHQPTARVKKGPVVARQPRDKRELLGGVEKRLLELGKDWRYADAIARQMFGVEKVQWCSLGQIHKVLIALEYRRAKATGGTT